MSNGISKDDILGLAEELSKVIAAKHNDLMTIGACANVMRGLAEIQRNAEDAARYRWLQKQTPYWFKKAQNGCTTDGMDVAYFDSDQFDEFVDSAMQANAEVKG